MGKVQTFVTKLNGRALQDLTMDCTKATNIWDSNYTDYLNIKRQFRGSLIQSRKQYQNNWFWCDDFSGKTAEQEQKRDDDNNVISGVPLGPVPMTWSFNGITMVNASYQHYTWVCVMRKMVCGPTMTTVM
jgi:hypothetical protein